MGEPIDVDAIRQVFTRRLINAAALGAEDERAAIVEWLRAEAVMPNLAGAEALRLAAARIEAGEHRKERA